MFKSKWDKWYDNQNTATKAYLDSESEKYGRLVISIAVPSFLLGIIFGFLIGFGL